jgi:hypothetical protein
MMRNAIVDGDSPIWDRIDREVEVLGPEAAPLLGMALHYGRDVHLQVSKRGPVRIERQ